MGELLGLLVLVLDIIAIVDVLKSSTDTGKKALLIIMIIILPVAGTGLYFLVGKMHNQEARKIFLKDMPPVLRN
jgi:flagellar basal body-associated protein FliL